MMTMLFGYWNERLIANVATLAIAWITAVWRRQLRLNLTLLSAIWFGVFGTALIPSDVIAQTGAGAFVGDISMTYDGFTQPRHEVMLAADEMGRIESVDVVVGQHVKADQVIARLEDALQVSALRTAEIQVNMMGEMNAAKVELELNQVRAEKIRELFANKMARPDELRRGEADLRIAKARVASMEEQLELRKIELQRAKVMLSRRRVRAPMDGVIAEIFLSPGESISPSSPSIVELLVVDELVAIFDVPVEDTLSLQTGSPVRVRLRSVAETIDASVSSITPKIDGESGTVQVRVKLSNPDGRLLSGDRCTLQILGAPNRVGSESQASRTLPPSRSGGGHTR